MKKVFKRSVENICIFLLNIVEFKKCNLLRVTGQRVGQFSGQSCIVMWICKVTYNAIFIRLKLFQFEF